MDLQLPPREAPKIVNDKNKELRKELVKKAALLQKYVHFEAAMKPHIQKIENQINELVRACDIHEAHISDYDNKIKAEQLLSDKNSRPDMTDEDYNSKVQRISELEQKLQELLQKKADYLKKVQNPNLNEEEEEEDEI